MLVLSPKDVCACLPMEQMIETAKQTFKVLSAGRVTMPLRTRLKILPHEGELLLMPAYVRDETNKGLAVKILSIFPNNSLQNLPAIHALVLMLDPDTGCPVAIIDGTNLTAIRTGAASGAATDLLSRHDSSIAAIFGVGAQARTQLEAICTVRRIETVWVYAPPDVDIQNFIKDMAGKGRIPNDIRVASSPQKAVRDADIICTATTSETPVFCDADLKEGVHINGIGSHTPEMQEIPANTVARSLVIVDSRHVALAETGDLIVPLRQGIINKEHIYAEIGDIILATREGRTDPNQITFFKSVGLAAQDVTAAQLAMQNAIAFGLGQSIKW